MERINLVRTQLKSEQANNTSDSLSITDNRTGN